MYRLLDHKIHNKLTPKVGIYFRIVSFLNNPYGERLQSDVEARDNILERTQKHQLSQVVSYLTEILDKDEKLVVHYAKENSNVLKFKVQFRHIS